jgi:hypothetical protein
MKKPKLAYLMTMISVSAVMLLLLYRPLGAQQVATDILDNVVIERMDYNAVIKVEFKQLFRYISHSPVKKGNAINVRISVPDIASAGSGQLVDSEAIQIQDDKDTGLIEVVYERQGFNSSYLIFYFNKDVSFEVIQGSDQRSISVIVYGLN